jgi:hypothetical protein
MASGHPVKQHLELPRRGAGDHDRQQRCNTVHGVSQARTARNAAGHDRRTAGFARMTSRLRPPRGRGCGLGVGWRLRLGRVVGQEGLPAERERDQRPVPTDGPVAADLEVGPAELAFDLLVALLNPLRSPYRRTTSARLACWARGEEGRGRLVSRYQLLIPGRLPGSVVAATSRSRRSGPKPPSSASAAHQVSARPSRKRRRMRRHRPGLRVRASRGRWPPRPGCGPGRPAPRCPCGA